MLKKRSEMNGFCRDRIEAIKKPNERPRTTTTVGDRLITTDAMATCAAIKRKAFEAFFVECHMGTSLWEKENKDKN